MALDTTLIGETAAALMGLLPEESDGEIVAVGIVAIVDDGDGTYTRVKCSRNLNFEQLGLFHAALEVVRSGWEVDDGDD